MAEVLLSIDRRVDIEQKYWFDLIIKHPFPSVHTMDGPLYFGYFGTCLVAG